LGKSKRKGEEGTPEKRTFTMSLVRKVEQTTGKGRGKETSVGERKKSFIEREGDFAVDSGIRLPLREGRSLPLTSRTLRVARNMMERSPS